MRRLFAFVLAAAQFVFHLMRHWPRKAAYWLRKLGGKFGRKTDRDGPYIVLRGISAVFLTTATLSYVAISPFPTYSLLHGDSRVISAFLPIALIKSYAQLGAV